jgi:hypothetical protein
MFSRRFPLVVRARYELTAKGERVAAEAAARYQPVDAIQPKAGKLRPARASRS